jgi:hypothetical protein
MFCSHFFASFVKRTLKERWNHLASKLIMERVMLCLLHLILRVSLLLVLLTLQDIIDCLDLTDMTATKEELLNLLGIMKELLPVGGDKWDKVLDRPWRCAGILESRSNECESSHQVQKQKFNLCLQCWPCVQPS